MEQSTLRNLRSNQTARNYLLWILLLFPSLVFSQDSIVQTNKKCVRNVSIVNTAAFLTGLSFLQFYWYSDYEQTPFHFYNDNDGWLQLDKCGHAFSSYVLSQVAYKSVRSCGMKKSSALIYGALTEIAYMTPIEILDGLNEGYGFSWGDLVANNTGAALYL